MKTSLLSFALLVITGCASSAVEDSASDDSAYTYDKDSNTGMDRTPAALAIRDTLGPLTFNQSIGEYDPYVVWGESKTMGRMICEYFYVGGTRVELVAGATYELDRVSPEISTWLAPRYAAEFTATQADHRDHPGAPTPLRFHCYTDDEAAAGEERPLSDAIGVTF